MLGYTLVFRNGIVESAAGRVVDEDRGQRVLWAREIEYQTLTKLAQYLAALGHAGVAPPFAIMLTLRGVDGVAIVGEPLRTTRARIPLRQEALVFPEVVVEDCSTADGLARALRPVFEALWNAAGYPGSQSYDASGNWNPSRD